MVDPASIQVNRRARRAKTDRLDLEQLMRVLLAYRRGEPRVCSMVHAPSPEQEDAKRPVRERERLITERGAHTNRIKALLYGQGIASRLSSRDQTIVPQYADAHGAMRTRTSPPSVSHVPVGGSWAAAPERVAIRASEATAEARWIISSLLRGRGPEQAARAPPAAPFPERSWHREVNANALRRRTGPTCPEPEQIAPGPRCTNVCLNNG